MIQVSMCKHVTTNTMLIRLEPRYVWRDVVDTGVIAAWEQKAHVDNNDVIVVFNGGHVLPDTHFAHTTNRNNLQRGAWRAWALRLVGQAKLSATIAVIDAFVYRHVNDVLARLHIHTFAGATLRTEHFAFASRRGVQNGVI